MNRTVVITIASEPLTSSQNPLQICENNTKKVFGIENRAFHCREDSAIVIFLVIIIFGENLNKNFAMNQIYMPFILLGFY